MNWLRLFDFDDLLILYHLGKGESITAAGRLLGLTQPAVTQRLRKMEDVFQVKVCERRGAQSVLTERGAEFAALAVLAIDLIENSFGRLLPAKARSDIESKP